MNELSNYKRELVAKSEAYRQAMAFDLLNVKSTVAWVPRTLQVLRWASPALILAGPVIGILTGRKLKKKVDQPAKKSLLGKVLAGIAMYRRVKSVVDTFRPARTM